MISNIRIRVKNLIITKLNLVKQNGFYPYKYLSNFENFKEELPSKGNFYSSLTGKKIDDK